MTQFVLPDELLLRRRGGSDHEDDGAWRDLSTLVLALLQQGPRFAIGEPAARQVPVGDVFNYWDEANPPADVAECLASWQATGLPVHTYHHLEADDFLARHFGGDVVAAFRHAHHPAMQADLFRLARLHLLGGLYVDADDAYRGSGSPLVFPAGAALMPLAVCRNCDASLQPVVNDPVANFAWYYLNNAPLFSVAGHPMIERALDRAVGAVIVRKGRGELARIHAETGPGSLSMAALEHVVECLAAGRPCDLDVSLEWDFIDMFRPLAYKETQRNWRRNAVMYSPG